MSTEEAVSTGTESTGRRRLALKPRDENRAKQLEQQNSAKSNPFGEAKPREQVLAEKLGQSESEILKGDVARDSLKLRLTAEQQEEKRAAEEALADAQAALEAAGRTEVGPDEIAEREAEVATAQQALDDLSKKFEEMTLQKVHAGEVTRVSELRRGRGRDGMQTRGGRGRGRYDGGGGYEGGYGQQGSFGRDYGNGGGRDSGYNYNQGRGGRGGRGGYGGRGRNFGNYDSRGYGSYDGRSSDSGYGQDYNGGYNQRRSSYGQRGYNQRGYDQGGYQGGQDQYQGGYSQAYGQGGYQDERGWSGQDQQGYGGSYSQGGYSYGGSKDGYGYDGGYGDYSYQQQGGGNYEQQYEEVEERQ